MTKNICVLSFFYFEKSKNAHVERNRQQMECSAGVFCGRFGRVVNILFTVIKIGLFILVNI